MTEPESLETRRETRLETTDSRDVPKIVQLRTIRPGCLKHNKVNVKLGFSSMYFDCSLSLKISVRIYKENWQCQNHMIIMIIIVIMIFIVPVSGVQWRFTIIKCLSVCRSIPPGIVLVSVAFIDSDVMQIHCRVTHPPPPPPEEKMRRFLFTHLSKERHCEGKVPCSRIESYVYGRGSNPDGSI